MRQREVGDEGDGGTARAAGGRLGLGDELARVIVADELGEGGDERHLDGEPISGDIGNNIERRTEGKGFGGIIYGGRNDAVAAAGDASDGAATAAGGLVKGGANDDRLEIVDNDFGLAAAEGGHRVFSEQVGALALFEGVQNDTELGIG